MAGTATKTVHPSITLERVLAAVEMDDNLGFCLACGTDVTSIEPDARRRKCECCGELSVYGAEELLLVL